MGVNVDGTAMAQEVMMGRECLRLVLECEFMGWNDDEVSKFWA
jgi:hypothetical protein